MTPSRCSPTEPDGDAGRVELEAPPEGFQLHVGPFVVQPYEELYYCKITKIDAPWGTLIQSLSHRATAPRAPTRCA
ncbi:MAG: hypothetical protein GY913_11040 [Proteobacteria bacterium]|nr:hypothetical protein [Pseudomonadota bacterium]MCP4917449.1 hypothetical protein [Pseudomonadota bacterium]